MKVIIVDDEAPARKRLIRLMSDFVEFDVIAEAKNGQQAIDLCKLHQPEIILMDVRMPGIDGIEASRIINELDQPPAIIYCTAYSDHALQAFETHAVDYLLKPVNQARLLEALTASTQLNKAQVSTKQVNTVDESPSARQHICARVRGNLVLVSIEDIFYFQADQKYVTVCHKNGEPKVSDGMACYQGSCDDLEISLGKKRVDLDELHKINDFVANFSEGEVIGSLEYWNKQSRILNGKAILKRLNLLGGKLSDKNDYRLALASKIYETDNIDEEIKEYISDFKNM
jgi:two-component system response regulator AlgR